ncbi:MAG: peptidase domain-containing ABC transporter [Hyphomicrobiaceae bacterium]
MSVPPQTPPGDHANVVAAQHKLLEQHFSDLKAVRTAPTSPASLYLDPLLKALKWAGEARQLAEAMPSSDTIHDLSSLRSVLETLNFRTTEHAAKLSNLTTQMVPCLFEDVDGQLLLVMDVMPDQSLQVFDSHGQEPTTIQPDDRRGIAYVVKHIDRAAEQTEAGRGWMIWLLSRFRPTFVVLLGFSLAINILALSLPLFILGVYQYAIVTKSLATLATLLAGVLLLIGTELYLRRLRGRALAYLGTRVENLLASHVYRHLLYMPVSLTETASIGSTVARFRQFEGLRDLFSGSLATALLDIPFLLVFVAAVFWIGGPLGFLPLGLIVVYLIMSAITIPKSRVLQRQVSTSRTKRSNFLIELVNKHNVIRDNSGEAVWLDRYHEISAQYLYNQFKSQQYNVAVQTFAQLFMILVGVMAVGLGTLRAIDGAMTVGALVATTALIWRGLAPIQSVFLGLGQVGQAIESFKQINHLMQLPQERDPGQLPTIRRSLKGHVVLRGASLRYSSLNEPALRGVSFEAKPGELVAITGDSGSGKSTLLKVILGLYRLQAGSIAIDGLDTRQFDIAELRHSIGYAPQKTAIFSGSIADNVRLADPTASLSDVRRALDRIGVLSTVDALGDGLDTKLIGNDEHRFADGFLRQIVLARAFLQPSPLYLLDEPASELDDAGDLNLMKALGELKGQATILMSTHRPSHMKLADRVVLLRSGVVVASGPPEEVVPLVFNQGPKKQMGVAEQQPLASTA